MLLKELRKALTLTQKGMGVALDVQQPAIAILGRRSRTHTSSLRAYIEAIVGTLRIVA